MIVFCFVFLLRSRHPFLSGTAEYEDYSWFHPMEESHKQTKQIVSTKIGRKINCPNFGSKAVTFGDSE